MVVWNVEKAKKENKSVKVILWNSSELLQRMMKPENEGMRYYWFNNEEFTVTWFHNQLESTINDLGPRYSPELNVQLEINEKFEYLRRSSKVYLSIQRIRKAFIKTGRNYVNEIIKANIYEQQGREKLLRIIESVSEQLKMNEYKEMQLLAFECISDELKKIEDINHEISNVIFSRMSHDFYDSEFYKAYSEFENTIYEIEGLIKGDWCLLNNPVMLVLGDAGTGKSHLLADICKNVLREGNQAILILGDYFISSVNPKEQIKQLFQSNLSYSAILGILNAIGQANGERIIFALDALNEGEGSLIWPKFLRGMITEVKRFPWIGFVMSVRSDNMDEIVPEDHYMVCPEYGEETATKFLESAGELRMRNFDPTLLLRNTYIESYQQPQKSWYCDYDLLDADYDNQKWLTDEVNFGKMLIEFSDRNNRRWIALCNYPYWNEYRDDDKEEYSSKKRKVMNAHIQSILMKKEDIEKWKKWNQNYQQESIYAIKAFNCSSMFYKENYWNVEYEEFSSNTDTEGWTELFINRKSTGILYANTSQRYIWEEEYDFSKEDAIAFDIPTKVIAEGMKMYDKGDIGAYYRDDMLVCYNPGIKAQSNHLLLIDRELLINWLEENDLCILWIVTIEKQILNGRQGAESFIEWQGYYTLEDGNLEGKLEAVRNMGLPKENKMTEEVVKSEISTISSEGNENHPDVADVLSKYLGRPLLYGFRKPCKMRTVNTGTIIRLQKPFRYRKIIKSILIGDRMKKQGCIILRILIPLCRT